MMRALVTGGGGFLGAALARHLNERGDDVRVFGRHSYPDLECIGIDSIRGDLANAEAVEKACEDREVIFHVGGKVGLWGSYEDYFAANVLGTKNVLRACHRLSIRKLVYTSSPSVVFDGRDVEGWDESAPYPKKFDSYYSRSKAQAEEMVLAANHEGLATVSLRPHLILGPGDRHLFPRILAKASAGKLYRIGNYNKLIDTTYIDDVVEAHVLAAVQLSPISDIAGKAYFLSSGQPRPIWDIVNHLLSLVGLRPVKKKVPYKVAMLGAHACEVGWQLFGINSEPPLTRFLVRQLTTAHWFNIDAAKRDIGWKPKTSMESGMERLAQWLNVTGPFDL